MVYLTKQLRYNPEFRIQSGISITTYLAAVFLLFLLYYHRLKTQLYLTFNLPLCLPKNKKSPPVCLHFSLTKNEKTETNIENTNAH